MHVLRIRLSPGRVAFLESTFVGSKIYKGPFERLDMAYYEMCIHAILRPDVIPTATSRTTLDAVWGRRDWGKIVEQPR